jgi:hypothetical protein
VNAPVSNRVDYNVHALGGRAVVPYVAPWTGEHMRTDRELVYRAWGEGIAYADETPADRDEHGVLWLSNTGDLGTGRPRFKDQHPLRQRHAMADLLCQVCAGPADRTEQGTLWLLVGETATKAGVPRRDVTAFPPVCASCARISVAVCPALRSGSVLVRARSRVCGVTGLLYARGEDGPGLSVWDEADQLILRLAIGAVGTGTATAPGPLPHPSGGLGRGDLTCRIVMIWSSTPGSPSTVDTPSVATPTAMRFSSGSARQATAWCCASPGRR